MIAVALVSALRSIWSKKTRSFLTMLGVIIGVSQIIALIGLGQGVKESVADEVTQLGSNVLFVLPGKIETSSGSYNPAASIGASTLTNADVEMMAALPDIKEVMIMGLMAAVPRVAEVQAAGTMVIAGQPNFLDFLKMYQLVAGQFFDASDYRTSEKVIVLGKESAARLFPNVAPAQVVGQAIQLGRNEFRVVGVMEMKETNSFFSNAGGGSGGLAVVPFSTAKEVNPNTQIFRIGVKADENADGNAVKRLLETKLKEAHGADDTTVFTQSDLLKVVDNILSLITKAIVALSSISLIVGGIGIMNIMLVAVSERTKEIGLRKALGATRNAILIQFLTESALISLIGGAIGVAIASIAGYATEAQAGLKIVVDLRSILIASGFSLGVGIIFGLLPAIRAARKDPIEALRYE